MKLTVEVSVPGEVDHLVLKYLPLVNKHDVLCVSHAKSYGKVCVGRGDGDGLVAIPCPGSGKLCTSDGRGEGITAVMA